MGRSVLDSSIDGPTTTTGQVSKRPAREGEAHVLLAFPDPGPLARALESAGYRVSTAPDVDRALDLARAGQLACVVAGGELTGGGVARLLAELRARPEPAGAVPIAVLDSAREPAAAPSSRGADLVVDASRTETVVRAVAALCRIARQPRETAGPALLSGTVETVSVAGLLSTLAAEKRSGSFVVGSGARRLVLRIVAGEVVGGSRDEAVAIVRAMLAVGRGRFRFLPAAHTPTPSRTSLREVVLEATRLDEEAKQVRRGAATASPAKEQLDRKRTLLFGEGPGGGLAPPTPPAAPKPSAPSDGESTSGDARDQSARVDAIEAAAWRYVERLRRERGVRDTWFGKRRMRVRRPSGAPGAFDGRSKPRVSVPAPARSIPPRPRERRVSATVVLLVIAALVLAIGAYLLAD